MATILSLDSVSSQFHTNSRMPSRNTALVELTLYFVQSGSTDSSMDSCIDTPFFTRKNRSSGMDGARPFFLRIRKNLMVVNISTCATSKLSLKVTPKDEGVIPFFANLQNCSLRSSGFSLNQLGARRLYGSVVEDIPLPGPNMRPMVGPSRSIFTNHALNRKRQAPIKVGKTRKKPTRKMKPRATEQTTHL